MSQPDVTITGVHGGSTIWTLHLNTELAQEWVRENVEVPDYMRSSEAVIYADHRPGRQLAEAMQAEGLTVAVGRRNVEDPEV